MTDDTWQAANDSLAQLYEPDDAARWLGLPNKLLGGRAPCECEPREVLLILRQLLDGAYI